MSRTRVVRLSLVALVVATGWCNRMQPPEFELARLDKRGNILAENVADASCIEDRKTALVWELKTGDGLRAAQHTYTWFNPEKAENNGYEGLSNGGNCTGSTCDTLAYVQAVNREKLCGFDDWRLPQRHELGSLVDYAVPFPGPTVPRAYFPTMRPESYWTGSIYKPHYTGVWAWRFDFGYDYVAKKDERLHIILVRGTVKNAAPKTK